MKKILILAALVTGLSFSAFSAERPEIFLDGNFYGLKFYELKLCSNVGDLNVSDSRFITLNGKTNVGDLNIEMSDSISDYSVSASTNTGDISIAGREYSKNYEATGTNNSKKIQLNTNTGDIRLK